jgi:hypothetical protein
MLHNHTPDRDHEAQYYNNTAALEIWLSGRIQRLRGVRKREKKESERAGVHTGSILAVLLRMPDII